MLIGFSIDRTRNSEYYVSRPIRSGGLSTRYPKIIVALFVATVEEL